MSYGGADERTAMLKSTKDARPAERREAGYLYTMKETGIAIVAFQVIFFVIFQMWGHIGIMVRLHTLQALHYLANRVL